jgi:hypothetical protein
VPLNRWFSLLGQSLALLSCQPSSDEALRANPAAGQALAVALEVSQVARATAESLALSPAAGCRPSTVCGTGPATITTTVTLRRQQRSGTLETVERTVWMRDDRGNISLAVQRSTPAPAGGQTAHELQLRRIGGDRFGALDGRFVKAIVAPLLDERLAADPQAPLDSLFALATAPDGATPRCSVTPLRLPGRLQAQSSELLADRRTLRLTVELPSQQTLEMEADELVSCTADAITAPEAAAAAAASNVSAALEAFLTEGHAAGWLLPAPPLEAPRR